MAVTTEDLHGTDPASHQPSDDDRQALLRAFRSWCRDDATADDLTQEALFEAWRSRNAPEGPDAWRAWLFGIARNVLLRWRRTTARHTTHVLPAPESDAHLMLAASTWNLDDLLDRSDLVDVLDAALARIPAASRQALILKYIDELPQKEIAVRLGIHEKALEGKLHRGKSAMQRYLTMEGAATAESLDLVLDTGRWVTTRLWCPACGVHRMEGRWAEDGSLWLDCPACDLPPVNGWRSRVVRTNLIGKSGLTLRSRYAARSFGSALKSLDSDFFARTRNGLYTTGICDDCGGETQAYRVDVPYSPAPEFGVRCLRCNGLQVYGWLRGQTAIHPTVRAWTASQRRVRTPPPRLVERNGRSTLVFEWESLTSNQTLAVFRDFETLEFRGDILPFASDE